MVSFCQKIQYFNYRDIRGNEGPWVIFPLATGTDGFKEVNFVVIFLYIKQINYVRRTKKV